MEIPFQIIFAALTTIVLITMLIYLISLYREVESKNKVLNSFNSLKNKVENLCWSFPFTQENEKILINENVIAIFVFPTSITKLEDFNLILNEALLEGDFLCLAYKNERIKCEKLSCNATMKSYYYEKKEEFLDFFVKSFYGIKEFEINLILFRNLTKVNILQ